MLWTAVERWGSRTLALVVFSVLGRLLAPEAFGLVAIVTAFMAVFAVFVEYGFAQSLVQRETVRSIDIWTSFWTSLVLGLVMYGLVWAATPLIVLIYREPALTELIPVAGLVLIFSGLSSVPAAVLQRELSFRPLAARQLTGAIVGSAVALILALLGAGVWALVIQPVAMALAGTVTLWIAARWVPRLEFSFASLRASWAFSVQVVMIELLNALQSNVDKFIVGFFFTPAQLGYYFLGQRVLTILMEIVASVMSKVSLSALSRVQTDHQRFLQYFYTFTFASAAAAFPIFGLVTVFGYPLTAFVFGPGWEDAVPIMALLAPSAVLASVTFFDKSALLAKGRGDVSLGVAAGQFVFGTAVLFASVPFGLYSVAAGRSIRQFLYWPVRILALKRHSGVVPREYLQRFVAPTVGIVALVGGGLLLQLTPWADAPLPMLSFVLPAGVIVSGLYIAIVALIARRQIRQILAILRRPKGNGTE
ncbi:lipopolysaccharide biosynthesis protein [Agromyces albus]|uniref:lipopolysaccharide biosynthesis protein n=1 Tax=Agromyces albus TaxID=205332 RepID=UPI0027D92EBC|nr:lipopolysaccharide biosynthesis protein [Agromyces albus]